MLNWKFIIYNFFKSRCWSQFHGDRTIEAMYEFSFCNNIVFAMRKNSKTLNGNLKNMLKKYLWTIYHYYINLLFFKTIKYFKKGYKYYIPDYIIYHYRGIFLDKFTILVS